MKICFIGYMRSGKDTAADYLKSRQGGTVIKFAGPLYEIQSFIQKRCYLPAEKDRLLLQWLGTDWGRAKDPEIWVNIFKKDLENLNPANNVYVTDCRFRNEAKICRDLGFKLIRINRPLDARLAAGATNLTHLSETDLNEWTDYDAIVENDGSLEDFEKKIYDLYTSLLQTKQFRRGITDDPTDPRLTRGADTEPTPQAEVYLVLSEEERAKGFIRPLRRQYKHVGCQPKYPIRDLTPDEHKRYDQFNYVKFEKYPEEETAIGCYWTQARLDNHGCGGITTMGLELCETYARNPKFYGSTYCCQCQMHRPVEEFIWIDDGAVVGS